jgi:hypothetical protein
MAATGGGSTKEAKPTLGGTKFKTRKRDEKVKLDVTSFSEQLIAGLRESGENLDEVRRFLDGACSSQLDYRRYAEPLLDILVAGGVLAPGGGKVEGTAVSPVSVFQCEPMVEAVRGHLLVMTRLLQRYKYLKKGLEDEMKKILKFLKAFQDSERRSLAIYTGLLLSEMMVPASVLTSLLSEVLVKEGLSLQFITLVFQTWLSEKNIAHIGSALRKAQLEARLTDFLPASLQSALHFDEHFSQAGLEVLVRYRRAQESVEKRRVLKKELEELLETETTSEEIIDRCQQHMEAAQLTDVDVTVLLWRSIMASVEWNKKEELVAEQALKHLMDYTSVFLPFCQRGTPQLTLLIKMQEFCYDNMNFMKVFHRIALLFYKNDVLTEQAIRKWFDEAHIAKGKSVFLSQMKPMVDWLDTAEEEEET